MIFHLPTQYSDSPISVNTNPTTDTTMTMLPIIRFSIQMPRKLNCVRTLLTKKVMPNHHAKAPNAMAKYPVTASNTSTPSTYKSEAGEKAYKKEYNQRIGKRDGKRRYEVMKIGTLVDGYRTDGLYRIAAERINAKRQQKNASEKLQVKDVLVDIIKNETHPVARQQSICNIA